MYSPCSSPDISIRAKSPPVAPKAEMAITFIVKPEAFMQPIISMIAKRGLYVQRNSNFIIKPYRLRFRPMVLHFCACPGDSGRESIEKYRVIALRVVGSDLLDRKRIERAFASRDRVKGL